MFKRGVLDLSKKTKSIVVIVAKIALIVLSSEVVVMFILLPPIQQFVSPMIANILDAVFLVLISAPMIAAFVINPFIVSEVDLMNKLKLASTCDSLTGLYNRSVLSQLLDQALTEFNNDSECGYVLLMIDIDNFKQVNDTLGHPAGDELLVSVANRLRDVCSETDIICRLGGDEFAIVHRYLKNSPDYQRLTEKIINAMLDDFIIYGVKYSVVLSIGFAEITNRHSTAAAILSDADIALYQAKKDYVVHAKMFNNDMKYESDKLFKLTQDIKSSIVNNQLSVHYQPIFDIQTGKMIGAEALSRWHHPQYGEVSPDIFIPIAESNGFICDLFRFLLMSVCEFHRELEKVVDHHFYISINISGAQFKYGNISQDLYNIVQYYGLHPSKFRLELTESSFIDYQSYFGVYLSDMVDKGFLFLLDDFGAGFSSIGSLYQIPFDAIKIDRFFMRDIIHDFQSQRLFDGIINLAKTIDIPIIVEGVETEMHHEYIKNLHLQYAQGFYYSRPLSAKDFRKYATTIRMRKI